MHSCIIKPNHYYCSLYWLCVYSIDHYYSTSDIHHPRSSTLHYWQWSKTQQLHGPLIDHSVLLYGMPNSLLLCCCRHLQLASMFNYMHAYWSRLEAECLGIKINIIMFSDSLLTDHGRQPSIYNSNCYALFNNVAMYGYKRGENFCRTKNSFNPLQL